MHCDHLVGNRYFVPFFVFYTESAMLGPRFVPESLFYSQSVMLSPRFIPECVFCFVLYFLSHVVSDMFFLFYFKKKVFSVESLYHMDSNMFRRFNKVKPCSADLVLGWVTKYE